MNKQINHIAVAAVLLLVALIVATTYWQTWASAGLADRQDNAIKQVAQFSIRRGLIYAADGKTVLAANVSRKVGDQTLYFRRYPSRGLFSDVVGYSTQSRNRTGLERSRNDYLTSSNTHLDTLLDKTLDRLRGSTIKGNNLVLTVRPGAQFLANKALEGKCGAIVALEPATGKVLVMATSPRYDPNLVERRFGQIDRNAAGAPCRPAAPLLNRATSGLYPPGSTFKVVTAAAALESGKFTPDSTFNDPGYCIQYGKRVNNYDTSSPFGTVNLKQGLQHSINSVFCNIGKALGAKALVREMERFGFYGRPPLETPETEREPSGLYQGRRLFRPKTDFQVDAGRLAFGQERLLVSPLQMAMVAAAVANDGVVMKPYVVDRVTAPNGRKVIVRTKPQQLSRAMSPETAQALTEMMELVVSGGTGTAAKIDGVAVAGKTGTAETGVAGSKVVSFVTFAPTQQPKVAIAVMLENQTGSGGRTAAPIARTIMESLLGRRST